MKKIIIVGRPYSNGGDYLIYHRLVNVIKKNIPDVKIDVKLGSDEQLNIEELNEYDAIVTGGGGAQFSEEHIRTSFLYKHFDEIQVPVHYMGTGLYGADGTNETVFGYQYSEEMSAYFKKVVNRGGQIASRDWTVDTVLRNNGIDEVIMAGCPAWYDVDMLERTDEAGEKNASSNEFPKQIKVIAVSNHGLTKNAEFHGKKLDQIEELVLFLKRKFDGVKILLTFNDGYDTKYSRNYNMALKQWAEEWGVVCVDLSNDAQRFKALNEIDLHIGFRVHTHIYCISRKIPSLLIEEDIRGYGMNESLHLPHLTAYDKGCGGERFRANPYLLSQILVLLAQMDERKWRDYEDVFELIKYYYQTGMKKWMEKLSECIK